MSNYDVCIIGSGLTGLLAARTALRAGKRVAVLERGVEYQPDEFDRSSWWKEETVATGKTDDGFIKYENKFARSEDFFDDLVKSEAVGDPWSFKYNMWYGVGGSSQMWSGMAWRLCPNDFKTRTKFGYGTDWPISYDELDPYYAQAEQLLEVSGPSTDKTQGYRFWPWKNNFQFPEFKLSYLDKKFQEMIGDIGQIVPQPHAVRNTSAEEGGCVGAKTCVSYCPTKAIFKGNERLLPQIIFDNQLTILVNTCVVRLNWDEAKKKIVSVSVYDYENKAEEQITADVFFLCANALENIRLIKTSEYRHAVPFGAASHLVGRYFSSHGAVTYTVCTEKKVFPVRGRPTHGSVIEWVDRCDGDERTGVTMEVWDSEFTNGYHPFSHLRKFASGGHWGDHLFKLLDQYENRFCISMIFETEMTYEKYASINHQSRDKFGLPISRTDVRLTDLDRKSLDFIRAKANEIRSCVGVASVSENGCGINGNHPLGGLRMGASAVDSVVDSYSRSHDFENLYILGGGSFCSTGSFNPTLTITALTLRALNDPRLGWLA